MKYKKGQLFNCFCLLRLLHSYDKKTENNVNNGYHIQNDEDEVGLLPEPSNWNRW
uniref:hypothetical protein n=1 Tax=Fulvivirga sp. TaxID=1931237 RepID=UPI0040491293